MNNNNKKQHKTQWTPHTHTSMLHFYEMCIAHDIALLILTYTYKSNTIITQHFFSLLLSIKTQWYILHIMPKEFRKSLYHWKLIDTVFLSLSLSVYSLFLYRYVRSIEYVNKHVYRNSIAKKMVAVYFMSWHMRKNQTVFEM